MHQLASGYIFRSPTKDDIPAIIQLLYAHDIAETGEGDLFSVEDIVNEWEDLNPETDAWVFFAPDGALAGYATLMLRKVTGRMIADGYVSPSHKGKGIGSTILSLTEQRAHELVLTIAEETRLVLVNHIVASSDAARHLLESHHYTQKRVFLRMHITLDTPVSPQRFPEELSLRTCDGTQEDIYRIYEAVEEGFQDHWGHTKDEFDHWYRNVGGQSIDPSLWFVLQHGEKIVGTSLCRKQENGYGWVNYLTVLRPRRKQGLGLLLLRHSFSAFQQRGITRVGLSVDGESLTGAQRLYQRAGMEVTMYIGRYEKELRAGKDLRNETAAHA